MLMKPIKIHSTGPYTITLYQDDKKYLIRVEKDKETLYEKTYRKIELAEKVFNEEVTRCRSAHENN